MAHAIVGALPAALTGDAADPIDRLLWATGGEVLRLPTGAERGGEYDQFADGLLTTRDRRRLAGARLVSTDGGLFADQLLSVATERMSALDGMNADQFIVWYVGECLDGLAYRASARAGVRWEDQRRPEDDYGDALADGPGHGVHGAPGWFVAWQLRLVHPPKLVLLTELGRWAWEGGARPTVPADAWGAQLVAKFCRRAGMTL